MLVDGIKVLMFRDLHFVAEPKVKAKKIFFLPPIWVCFQELFDGTLIRIAPTSSCVDLI